VECSLRFGQGRGADPSNSLFRKPPFLAKSARSWASIFIALTGPHQPTDTQGRLRPPYTDQVLPERRQRDAIPAASNTFITSAAMNQYKPKYAAFARECVKK
jgi:hypothetical protein